MDAWADRIAGALLGTAVGDALGLPREGLSADRARRRFGDEVRHAFLFGRGMVSDDTEHTCMLAQALLAEPDDPKRFSRVLAWKLRFWLLGLPAGVGRSTARAIVRLWLGRGPDRSGVFSAGNGPSMRAALLGLCCGSDTARLREWVRASTRLTHTDPRAERAAFLVAFAASSAARCSPDTIADRFLTEAGATLGDADQELRVILAALASHLARGSTPAQFAEALGLERGVTGYSYHTVPAALYCWLRQPHDFRAVVTDVIKLGGDTDTTAAIAGAICGAGTGLAGIPTEWLEGILDWPRSVKWMKQLAERLARRFPVHERPDLGTRPMRLCWPALLPRNTAFVAIVLAHGLRRLLPPV